jgi:hypothetical protein
MSEDSFRLFIQMEQGFGVTKETGGRRRDRLVELSQFSMFLHNVLR